MWPGHTEQLKWPNSQNGQSWPAGGPTRCYLPSFGGGDLGMCSQVELSGGQVLDMSWSPRPRQADSRLPVPILLAFLAVVIVPLAATDHAPLQSPFGAVWTASNVGSSCHFGLAVKARQFSHDQTALDSASPSPLPCVLPCMTQRSGKLLAQLIKGRSKALSSSDSTGYPLTLLGWSSLEVEREHMVVKCFPRASRACIMPKIKDQRALACHPNAVVCSPAEIPQPRPSRMQPWFCPSNGKTALLEAYAS